MMAATVCSFASLPFLFPESERASLQRWRRRAAEKEQLLTLKRAEQLRGLRDDVIARLLQIERKREEGKRSQEAAERDKCASSPPPPHTPSPSPSTPHRLTTDTHYTVTTEAGFTSSVFTPPTLTSSPPHTITTLSQHTATNLPHTVTSFPHTITTPTPHTPTSLPSHAITTVTAHTITTTTPHFITSISPHTVTTLPTHTVTSLPAHTVSTLPLHTLTTHTPHSITATLPPHSILSQFYPPQLHPTHPPLPPSEIQPLPHITKPIYVAEGGCKSHNFPQPLPSRYVYVRLTAVGRGFLTRRLLQSEKVKKLRDTIKDARAVLESLTTGPSSSLSPEDMTLKERVQTQLVVTQMKFLGIFQLPVQERMAYIAHSRAVREERKRRKEESAPSLSSGRLSLATQRAIERRHRSDSSTSPILLARRKLVKPVKPTHTFPSKLQTSRERPQSPGIQAKSACPSPKQTRVSHPLGHRRAAPCPAHSAAGHDTLKSRQSKRVASKGSGQGKAQGNEKHLGQTMSGQGRNSGRVRGQISGSWASSNERKEASTQPSQSTSTTKRTDQPTYGPNQLTSRRNQLKSKLDQPANWRDLPSNRHEQPAKRHNPPPNRRDPPPNRDDHALGKQNKSPTATRSSH